MDLVEEIRNLATLNLSPDKFVVEVLIPGKKIPKRVMIIIDGDRGITIDDCADLSRKLSKEFEERALFGDENYLLEVSTPGLDHPLKLKRQYFKNIGRNFRVKTGAQTIVEGKLREVTEEKILLDQETGTGKNKEIKEIQIPFSEIDRAFVMVSFK
jgi:ribosome maturation factor RimP